MADVYSFKVKISLTGIKTIYWPIVLLMMARYFGLSEKIIFFSLSSIAIFTVVEPISIPKL